MCFTYQIKIRGRLSRALTAEFEQLGLTAGADHVETELHGPVVDQAALYGLVRHIEALGLELVELRQFPRQVDSTGDPPQRSCPHGPGEQ